MPVRRVLSLRTMQPQEAVSLDPVSTLAQGMVADWLASVGPVIPAAYSGGGAVLPGVSGARIGPLPNYGVNALLLPDLGSVLGSNYTVAVVIRALTTGNTGFGNLSTSTQIEHLNFGGTMYLTGASQSRQAFAIPSWLDMTRTFCLVISSAVSGGSTAQTAYLNGRQFATATASGTTNGWTPSAWLGGEDIWGGDMEYYRFTAWNRALPAAEAEEFSAKFWAGYAPDFAMVPRTVVTATFNPAWARGSNIMIGAGVAR